MQSAEPNDQDVQILIDNLYKIAQTDPEMANKFLADYQYLAYQTDPIQFGERFLNERYTEDTIKILESVRDFPITVAISATGTGKTFCAGSVATWFYKCFPNSQIYTAAAPPEDNLRRLLWGEISKKINGNKSLFTTDKVNVMNISRNEWSFITGVTIPQSGTPEERESKFSGKHSSHLLFIVDEGDAVPDEVFKGIDGCMSGGMARLLVMFNPRRLSGAVYRMIRDGRANVVHLTAFNHPNVVEGKDLIPGAVTREMTLKRVNEQTLPLQDDEEPDSDCFEVPDFLVGAIVKDNMGIAYPPIPAGWRRIIDQEFHYKVLGKYPTKGSNQLISREWISRARSNWDLWSAKYGENPPEQVRPICGLDVADLGDDWNKFCRRYGSYVGRIEGWKNVDPSRTASKAAELGKKYRTECIKVDAIGVGASVAALIRKEGVKAERVTVSEKPTKYKDKDKKAEFYSLRDQLWWALREWLRTETSAMLPPDEKLLEEIAVVTYEEPPSGKLRVMEKNKMRKELGRSPDTAESLILTFAPKEPGPRIRMIGKLWG